MIDRLLALQTLGSKLNIEGISRLCTALGHPERSFIGLHIAGTNGKGSVAAMVHRALVASGLRTARYTSPHLSDFSERFVIGREAVDVDVLTDVLADVLDCAENLVHKGTLTALPTFFEATTATAFELFRRVNVEVGVIEVGLGGRLDATNVITSPTGAITSVGFDHQEHLGDTLESIAREKAGIIKPGMTIVTGALPPVAAAVVGQVAAEQGARLIEAVAEVQVRTESINGRLQLEAETSADRYGPLTLALRGDHQVGNALVAIRLLEAVRSTGLTVSRDAIEHGLKSVVWPARLELLMLEHDRHVLIDAAHNVDGAQALAAYLHQWHPERPTLVVGAMDDKDLDGILRKLLPVTASVVATTVDMPRAVSPSEVARRVMAIDPSRVVSQESNPSRALTRALAHDRTVCVAGSIFVAAAVRDAVKSHAILQDIPASL